MSTDSKSNPLAPPIPSRSLLWKHEDWMATWIGVLFLIIIAATTTVSMKMNQKSGQEEPKGTSLLTPWLKTAGDWSSSPLDSLRTGKVNSKGGSILPGLGVTGLLLLIPLAVGAGLMTGNVWKFIPAFLLIWLLAFFSFVLSKQEIINQYNLEYVIWGLAVGMIISNTIGVPKILEPAILGEFYIKTGLVLLGSEILFGKLLTLGQAGIFISWLVTPVVLISTFLFGQKVLKMQSKSLNMVISADMSVCGVSAAIATGAACKAKKEEISCAIGLSLAFTAIMMIVQPKVAQMFNMDEMVAGAWIGGTIDSTGAVAAAGTMISEKAGDVAVVIKMIQNILIGMVAFGVAIYWTTCVEKSEPNADGSPASRPGISEIWRRFPKFILGFIGASLIFSIIAQASAENAAWVNGCIDAEKSIRTWLFCLAFVCMGLEMNFRTFAPYFVGGKPLQLYVVGQSLNLLLSFLMSYLMFGIIYKDQVNL